MGPASPVAQKLTQVRRTEDAPPSTTFTKPLATTRGFSIAGTSLCASHSDSPSPPGAPTAAIGLSGTVASSGRGRAGAGPGPGGSAPAAASEPLPRRPYLAAGAPSAPASPTLALRFSRPGLAAGGAAAAADMLAVGVKARTGHAGPVLLGATSRRRSGARVGNRGGGSGSASSDGVGGGREVACCGAGAGSGGALRRRGEHNDRFLPPIRHGSKAADTTARVAARCARSSTLAAAMAAGRRRITCSAWGTWEEPEPCSGGCGCSCGF
ncbi:hypothetical protein TSOC_006740 [Tetrabaena socialis]|uniref:Uncharacterized protein n=1 Tax=Tetrabaena socialis TaxID=47790 RepID=A0A2J8A2T9_9CHLO|nr:hypothetical protein TSOC_006740 [Tetrabaena socialis]|eukprot:PNH06837.1 hypothetical protein TSOC_006740 [Tetrabaena socialis]